MQPLAFDLLAMQVERARHLVTKDELLDLVWSKMVVEEAALRVQVLAGRPRLLRSRSPLEPPLKSRAIPRGARIRRSSTSVTFPARKHPRSSSDGVRALDEIDAVGLGAVTTLRLIADCEMEPVERKIRALFGKHGAVRSRECAAEVVDLRLPRVLVVDIGCPRRHGRHVETAGEGRESSHDRARCRWVS